VSHLISVEGLEVRYGSGPEAHTALSGATFCVAAGERVAVIGASGSGKTSLLRALGGLITPAAGKIVVAGHTVCGPTSLPREAFRDIGLVFQDYGLVRQLTSLQNVLCGKLARYGAGEALIQFSDADRRQAQGLLEQLGLGERMHLVARRLSGGEQQRVGVARLLMQAPQVMLLDEPVASLDVQWSRRVMMTLAEQRPESAIVAVLHDLEAVRLWATRVLVVSRGQIVFDGPAERACAMVEGKDAPDTAEPEAAGPAPAPRMSRGAMVAVGVAATALYVWSLLGINLDSNKVFGSFGKGADFISRTMPPDVSVAGTVLTAILETIQMAVLGTTVAAAMALPLSILAARNVSPLVPRAAARFVLNFMRTIPSIIWGLFFVAIVGLGPFPGVLALACYATGYLGKFYYEAIESIDARPLVALRVAGASRAQRFRYGVFPQVFPVLAGHTLYMLEYNVRAASVLGVVGAGGVGFYLYTYINNFQYRKAATALAFMLGLVILLDLVSERMRARFQAD
jgi:phosphonate transport system permease protein